MSLTERPTWRITRCEAQVLLDLDALARALRAPEHWVPEPLIALVMSARKGGKPLSTLRTLKRHGYVAQERAGKAWRRTSKQIPMPGTLPGEAPHLVPPGAIERLARAWKRGQRTFCVDDLAETAPDLEGHSKFSPLRHRI